MQANVVLLSKATPLPRTEMQANYDFVVLLSKATPRTEIMANYVVVLSQNCKPTTLSSWPNNTATGFEQCLMLLLFFYMQQTYICQESHFIFARTEHSKMVYSTFLSLFLAPTIAREAAKHQWSLQHADICPSCIHHASSTKGLKRFSRLISLSLSILFVSRLSLLFVCVSLYFLSSSCEWRFWQVQAGFILSLMHWMHQLGIWL